MNKIFRSIRGKLVAVAPSFALNFALRAASYVGSIRRGFTGLRQVEIDENQDGIHVLIVGPGEKRIPVSGWGAVELVIANQVRDLKQSGLIVDLVNSWNIVDWLTCFARKPQVVICHYDVFAFRARLFSKWFGAKCVTLTHYAYAQQPSRWDPQFGRYANNIAKSDVFVALNAQIAGVFSKLYPGLKVVVIPNGIDVNRIASAGDHRGAICLGKVEPRKRQVALASQLTGDENIRFVGDVVDPAFDELSPKQKSLFIGPWSRNEVESKLANFATLFLLGDGEADALVLYEAQAAGLEILTNEVSVGAQNQNLSWIHVIPSEHEIGQLYAAAGADRFSTLPSEISSYAANHYGSALANAQYAALVRSLI